MNPRIRNLSARLLNRSWTTLQSFTYEYEVTPQEWQWQTREAYDRGDGVCALLFDPRKETILLARQFRLPTYLNGNDSGLLLEVCAGKLEMDEDPLTGIEREVREELGHSGLRFERLFDLFMSPGSVTERIHFFLAEYGLDTKVASGGGLADETEHIDLVEVPLSDALTMIRSGEIRDAKTIILIQHLKLQLSVKG